MANFFVNNDTQSILNAIGAKISTLKPSSKFEIERNSLLIKMIKGFLSVPEMWDDLTQFNIENASSSLIKALHSDIHDKPQIDRLFVSCAKFYLESYIIGNNDLYDTANEVRAFLIYDKDEFDSSARSEIIYTLHEMPLSITRKLLNSDAVRSYKQYKANIDSLKKMEEEWEENLNAKLNQIKTIQDTLDKQDNAFNFVGLTRGFSNLGKEKKKELDTVRYVLFFLGGILPTPLIIEMIYLANNDRFDGNALHFLSLIPVFSITVILAYFFRVALTNFNSAKAQLSQIELRKSLCQFIQKYAEYAKDIKSKDKELLKKFEEVIFSNIMTEESKIPSTFDGLEQLASLISSLKGK